MTAFALALLIGVASWTGLSVVFARVADRAIADAQEPPIKPQNVRSQR